MPTFLVLLLTRLIGLIKLWSISNKLTLNNPILIKFLPQLSILLHDILKPNTILLSNALLLPNSFLVFLTPTDLNICQISNGYLPCLLNQEKLIFLFIIGYGQRLMLFGRTISQAHFGIANAHCVKPLSLLPMATQRRQLLLHTLD